MSIKQLLRLFLLWQVIIIGIVLGFQKILPLHVPNLSLYKQNPGLYFRANFDGRYYLDIAHFGPNINQDAFFPLYPALIRFFSRFLPNPVLTGVLISSLLFFLGLHYFVKLIQLDFSSNIAYWSVISLLAFPASFYFTSIYTESLFFFLSLTSFYYARQKKWWLAAFLVALATYTRFVGIFLIIPLIWEYLNQFHKITLKSLLIFLVMPIGLLFYMNQLIHIRGDSLSFIHSQTEYRFGRNEKLVLFYQVLIRYSKILTSINPRNPIYFSLSLEAAITILFVSIGIILMFRYRPSYAFYTLSSIILPTLTGTLTSMPRYVLLCFPVFIYLGELISKHPPLRVYYFGFSFCLFAISLILFSHGFWVA